MTISFREDFDRELQHDVAARGPVWDDHSHNQRQSIAEIITFDDLYKIWLAGDQYKWSVTRRNGVARRFCTGHATPRKKFFHFATMKPRTHATSDTTGGIWSRDITSV